MAVSQNGYKADDSSLIASYVIPGTKVKISLRKGDVSVVLLDFAAWYSANIEALTQADTGGYNPRPISGSTVLSNHASGTAEDLRWNRHARGAHGTFTSAQKTKIHTKLKEYDGVIRWGEDYVSATIDGMHYEINKGTAAVKVQADRIRAKNAPARKVDTVSFSVKMPVLKQGDQDTKLDGYNMIVRIQRIMGIDDDGVWGPATTAAIAKWCDIPAVSAKIMTEAIWRKLLGLTK